MNKSSILIIDDNPHIINTIVDILLKENKNYHFFQAYNGKIGYKVATAKLPDLIITDWDMPEVNGIDLIKKLKANKETANIPVIMATGIMLTPQDLQTAFDAGAVDYIRKPINEIELSARVSSMLLLSKSYQEIQKQKDEIAEHAEFMSALLDTIPHPVYYYDFNGICKGCNKSFMQLSPDFKEGMHVNEFFTDDDSNIHREKDELLKSTQDVVTYEQKIHYADNSVHDIIFSKAVYGSAQKEPLGIICIMTDITELRNAHRHIIESQEKELTGVTMRLMQSNEKNKKIFEDLEKLKKYTGTEGQKIIRSIINSYNQGTSDKSWEEFDLRFKQVHKTFYKNLSERFPNLTQNERKLCAFLKLGMTTKEISTITYLNPQSIDMARYRMRKKMKLPKDENLSTFISKI